MQRNLSDHRRVARPRAVTKGLCASRPARYSANLLVNRGNTMTTSETIERSLPARPGLNAFIAFMYAAVITSSLSVANVAYQTSQTWGRFGGPYSWWDWLWPCSVLIAFSMTVAVFSGPHPHWRKIGAGLLIGALVGAALGFLVTALIFKVQTDSYLINRPECEPRTSYTTGPANQSCHNKHSTRY